MNANQRLILNLDTKYSRHLLSLPETELRKRLVHTLEQLTHYASLADSEVHQEDPVLAVCFCPSNQCGNCTANRRKYPPYPAR